MRQRLRLAKGVESHRSLRNFDRQTSMLLPLANRPKKAVRERELGGVTIASVFAWTPFEGDLFAFNERTIARFARRVQAAIQFDGLAEREE
jgi:hypothetical protein